MDGVDWGVMGDAIPYMAKGALITLEISPLALIAGGRPAERGSETRLPPPPPPALRPAAATAAPHPPAADQRAHHPGQGFLAALRHLDLRADALDPGDHRAEIHPVRTLRPARRLLSHPHLAAAPPLPIPRPPAVVNP